MRERIWYDDFEGRWHNLAHRFTYEIFLELLICGMISLAVRRPYTDDNFSDSKELVKADSVSDEVDFYEEEEEKEFVEELELDNF